MNRKSNRLENWDYSQNGYYFVTIITDKRKCLFGKIQDGEMKLSKIGNIAKNCWLEISKHYPDIILDKFIIMPNHLHGIIVIDKSDLVFEDVRVQNLEPLRNRYQQTLPRSLGSIIRGYKIGVTKYCRQYYNIQTVWHTNYYDHIIRSDKSLNAIREYIIANPLKWSLDENNPKNFM